MKNNLESNSDHLERREGVLLFSYTLFITCLVVSSITASKLWEFSFFGLNAVIPVGTSLFALTFLSTDVVSEVWGKKHAQELVWFGLAARLLTFAFFYVAVSIPPASFWGGQDAYSTVLTSSYPILIAGILAYLVSQLNDVFIFHYLREKHKDRNLFWLRNIGSTLISQFLDSFIFIVIAFAASLNALQIAQAVFGQLFVKWLIALIDTPLAYFFRNYARGKRGKKIFSDWTG